MSETFSKRYGFYQPAASVVIRQDAPLDLRAFIVEIAYDCGFTPTTLRSAICRILKRRPDPSNWSEYPNIDNEVHGLIDDCAWYRVYDVVEALLAKMYETPFSYDASKFEIEFNDFCVENGIGWKVTAGVVETRSTEALEQSVQRAIAALQGNALETAQRELREATHDLSRRPDPDLTGAVHHAMAALECVARNACGDAKATLGEVIKRYDSLIPSPLDQVVSKAWGFASENARHLREGQALAHEEAELIVGVSSVLCSYLAAKREA